MIATDGYKLKLAKKIVIQANYYT